MSGVEGVLPILSLARSNGPARRFSHLALQMTPLPSLFSLSTYLLSRHAAHRTRYVSSLWERDRARVPETRLSPLTMHTEENAY